MVVTQILLGAFLAQSGECPSALGSAREAYERGEYRSAVSGFERARTVCPQPTSVLLPLAQAQLLAGQVEKSLETLDALLASNPENPTALKLKGDVLYLLAREPEAEAALKSALKADPEHTASCYALGRIYYQQNRFTEAVALFQALVEKDPKNFRAHDNLALSYAGLGDEAGAMRHFRQALDLVHKDHPEYDTVYANLANFMLQRGELKQAFNFAAEAAKRNPSVARNFFLTGKALAGLDKHELSIRWFESAVKLDPDYPEPRYWLANVYRKLGKPEDAAREIEIFRELNKKPARRR